MKTTTKSINVFCKLIEAKILLKKKKFCQLLKTLSHKTKKKCKRTELAWAVGSTGIKFPWETLLSHCRKLGAHRLFLLPPVSCSYPF